MSTEKTPQILYHEFILDLITDGKTTMEEVLDWMEVLITDGDEVHYYRTYLDIDTKNFITFNNIKDFKEWREKRSVIQKRTNDTILDFVIGRYRSKQ
ncbi:MAG TPA: hypothetical protein VK808_07215 [Bacteroidia bacterium]|jgi:hypothetical protein|nr:hypothetical protein [Bacteroidia bacterium]